VAFFIFLRETLEASVIIAVLLQCMNRTMPRLKRQGACVFGLRGPRACVVGACRLLYELWACSCLLPGTTWHLPCFFGSRRRPTPCGRQTRTHPTSPPPPAVWWGAAAGIALSLVFGGIFALVYYLAKSMLFKGTAKAIFQVRV
jgi:hypothetical protein